MDPDKYQQAWQAHSSETRVSVDADVLLSKMQEFRAGLFFNDFGAIGLSLLLLPVWIWLGVALRSPWTWYLMVPALVWVAAFNWVVRARRRRVPQDPGQPLLSCVQESLSLVEHQIWLQRNLLWWNLLPLGVSLLAFCVHVAWLNSDGWLDALGHAGPCVFLVAVYSFIYYMTQRVVRTRHEPRRQELLTLLASLSDETAGNVTSGYPILMSDRRVACTPRRMLLAAAGFAAILLIGVPVILHVASFLFNSGRDDSARSPFAAVRWQASQPEVRVGDEWFRLVSLDELPASEIVDFSRRTYGDKWQQRFEEDLVELLTRMGHPPQDTVTLVVQSLSSTETRTLEDVRMTSANRRAIRNAAEARESGGQELATRPAVPIADAALFRTRIDEFLSAARTKAGFSGAVLVARGGQPVYQGAFGFSHLESRAPNTLDTPFRIASLSKQFTAAAIFRLEGQGKLNIDDRVHRYLSEFAEPPYRDITIHHLLTHTSGLPRSPQSVMGVILWNAMSLEPTPVDDYVRLAVETPLEFDPGTDSVYSNFGYRVLAALIARVTAREYADFMEQEVFQPLGMKDSGVARVTRPASEARVAEGLTFQELDDAGQPLFANGEEGRNYGAGYGSGGIFASANDLLRWDRVLAGDEFLSESQKARLFQPSHGYYACGWIVKKSGLDGRLYQMHNGANEGFFSQMLRVPADDLVIIAVGNVDGTPALDDVLNQLFRLCRSLPYHDP